MTHFELPLSHDSEFLRLSRRFEVAVARAGLNVSKRMTFKTRIGSTHWHITSAKSPGTLEFTVWPSLNRAWFSVHANRNADWIEPALRSLIKTLSTET